MRKTTYALAAIVTAAAAAALAPMAFAQGGAMSGQMTPAQYVTAAGQSDKFEVEEGRMAETKGASAKVKAFGRRMVSAHTQSTKMVMAAAMKSGLPQMDPPQLTSEQQQMVSQLQGMHGVDFDRTYVQQQLQAHEQALSVQQAYAQDGSDPALKRTAAKIVPVVESHISMLHAMQGAM